MAGPNPNSRCWLADGGHDSLPLEAAVPAAEDWARDVTSERNCPRSVGPKPHTGHGDGIVGAAEGLGGFVLIRQKGPPDRSFGQHR